MSQNKILAWVAIILSIFMITSALMSFDVNPKGMDMRLPVMLLFLVPIGVAVFFLSSIESLFTALLASAAGSYVLCLSNYTTVPYSNWPKEKAFSTYLNYLTMPLFTSGAIWLFVIFLITAYWLGFLSERLRRQTMTHRDSSTQLDDTSFSLEEEKVRFLNLQRKYDADINHLSSLIITLSDLAREVPSLLEVEGLLKLVLDKAAKLFSAGKCAIFYVDNDSNRLTYACSVGYDQEMLMGLKLTIDEESGIPGWCAKNGKFLSLEEVEKNSYMADILRINKVPVVFCQPIVERDKTIAVICVDELKEKIDEKELLRLTSILANLSAIAIENAKLMEKMKEQAIRDGLTGLYNHRHFYELFDEVVKGAKQRGLALGVFLIDIDHFKNFNDVYGHQLGDIILQQTAGIIQKKTMEGDIVARYGGEEFAVVCMRNDKAAVNSFAENLRKSVEDAVFNSGNLKLSVTISVGVAFFDPKTNLTTGELVKYCDEALYKAKESGRNKICFYG